MITSRSLVLRMKNVLFKTCRENKNTYFVFSNSFLNRAVYEIMCNNTVQLDGAQMQVWRMRISCWPTKVTHTHTLTICNTYSFSTKTMVTRTRLKQCVISVLWDALCRCGYVQRTVKVRLNVTSIPATANATVQFRWVKVWPRLCKSEYLFRFR